MTEDVSIGGLRFSYSAFSSPNFLVMTSPAVEIPVLDNQKVCFMLTGEIPSGEADKALRNFSGLRLSDRAQVSDAVFEALLKQFDMEKNNIVCLAGDCPEELLWASEVPGNLTVLSRQRQELMRMKGEKIWESLRLKKHIIQFRYDAQRNGWLFEMDYKCDWFKDWDIHLSFLNGQRLTVKLMKSLW